MNNNKDYETKEREKLSKKELILRKIDRLRQDLKLYKEIIYINIIPWKLGDISKMAMKDEYNKLFNENISLEQFNQAKAIKLYSQYNYNTLQKIKKLQEKLNNIKDEK